MRTGFFVDTVGDGSYLSMLARSDIEDVIRQVRDLQFLIPPLLKFLEIVYNISYIEAVFEITNQQT